MKYLSAFFILAASFLLLNAELSSSGSPGDKTGSPLDGKNCAQCHSSTPITMEWIQTNIPTEGYTAGETYLITFTASDNNYNKFGFELTSETATETIGSFSLDNTDEMRIYTGAHSVTHKSAGSNGVNNEKNWTFNWTAPTSVGNGDITFYAAAVAANNNGSNQGDQVYLSQLTVKENNPTTITSKDFTITAIATNNTLKVSLPQNETFNVTIYNSVGKLVLQDKINENTNLNISSLKAGVYTIQLASNNFKHNAKFLKLN